MDISEISKFRSDDDGNVSSEGSSIAHPFLGYSVRLHRPDLDSLFQALSKQSEVNVTEPPLHSHKRTVEVDIAPTVTDADAACWLDELDQVRA